MSAQVWGWTLGSVGVVSALSLTGAVALSLDEERFRRIVLVLVSFAAGALLGDAFLHLLPEITRSGPDLRTIGYLVLIGMGGFFIIEKVLHWHHAHFAPEEVLHPVAVTNIIGDGFHNFIDGALIAGAYATNTSVGIATTLAVALHEIPQEIGDMGILVHAGLTRRRALMLNLMTALTAVVGAVLALVLSDAFPHIERVLVGITAGGFIYIAGSDLIPELQRETRLSTAIVQFAGIASGVGLMAALTLLE